MEIGDIVNVTYGEDNRSKKEIIPDGIFRKSGKLPERGIVEWIGERFATLMMLDERNQKLYRRSFFFSAILEGSEKNV